MPQESLTGIYGAADLLVHPSLREGWPNVLLESMACGTPVLAADFDSAGEIIGAPEAGRIATEATPAGLAAAIKELLAAPPPREATRRYAENFDWQVTTAGQIELFRDICNPGETAVPEQAKRRRGAAFAIRP
jgi:glycosyltransferase involved in cell wall biosynthesis